MPHPAAAPRVVSGQRRPRLILPIAVVACGPVACVVAALVMTATPLSPGLVALAAASAAGVVVAIGAGRRIAQLVADLDRQHDALYRELLRLAKPAALGDIAFGIVHDLNNPLAIINEEAGWMTDLLDRSTLDPPSMRAEVLQSASAIAGQVKRSSEITGRILRWAREQDRGAAADGVDVNEAITRTLGLLERDLRAANVQVALRLEPHLAPVAGNAGEIAQVFVHLIKNALDAMKEAGGTLTVTSGRAGTMIHAQVVDSGPGIAPDVLTRIFEPYFSTKSDGEGSGLGLAISAWIVRQAGGRIEVDSAVGSGAAFRVVLPAAATRQRTGGSDARRSSAAGR